MIFSKHKENQAKKVKKEEHKAKPKKQQANGKTTEKEKEGYLSEGVNPVKKRNGSRKGKKVM